jgi:hypothetical protein
MIRKVTETVSCDMSSEATVYMDHCLYVIFVDTLDCSLLEG